MADPKDVDVTIRAAEAADIEALAELMIQLGYETRASEMQMRMETIRADKNYATHNNTPKCGAHDSRSKSHGSYTARYCASSSVTLASVVGPSCR